MKNKWGFFDGLGISNDKDINRESNSDLRCSEFISQQQYETLNTKVHAKFIKQQKENILNKKVNAYEIIKLKTKTLIDYFKQSE